MFKCSFEIQFGPSLDLKVNKAQRQRFQRYLTSFIKYGTPNYSIFPNDTTWDDLGYEGNQMTFGSAALLSALDTKYELEKDALNKTRCESWMNAPFWAGDEEMFKTKGLLLQEGSMSA